MKFSSHLWLHQKRGTKIGTALAFPILAILGSLGPVWDGVMQTHPTEIRDRVLSTTLGTTRRFIQCSCFKDWSSTMLMKSLPHIVIWLACCFSSCSLHVQNIIHWTHTHKHGHLNFLIGDNAQTCQLFLCYMDKGHGPCDRVINSFLGSQYCHGKTKLKIPLHILLK